MPRRSILSGPERDSLLAIPQSTEELIRLYTFSGSGLALIRQHRGAANRLDFGLRNPTLLHALPGHRSGTGQGTISAVA